MILKTANIMNFFNAIGSVIPRVAIGAAVGGSGAAVYSSLKNKDVNEEINRILVEDNLTDTSEFTKEHAPDMALITNKADLMANEKIDAVSRAILAGSLFKDNAPSTAAYLPIIKTLIAPERASKDLLGHEIGHHIDTTQGHYSILDSLTPIGVTNAERRAWAASPIRGSDVEKLQMGVREGASDTYKKGLKYGAGLGALISLPVLLARLRG